MPHDMWAFPWVVSPTHEELLNAPAIILCGATMVIFYYVLVSYVQGLPFQDITTLLDEIQYEKADTTDVADEDVEKIRFPRLSFFQREELQTLPFMPQCEDFGDANYSQNLVKPLGPVWLPIQGSMSLARDDKAEMMGVIRKDSEKRRPSVKERKPAVEVQDQGILELAENSIGFRPEESEQSDIGQVAMKGSRLQ